MKITVNLAERSYPIYLERGCTDNLKNYISTDKTTLILSDDGVPESLQKKVLNQFKNGILYVVKQGESSKSFEVYEEVLKVMLKHHFTRKDCLVSLGGGVIGDLGGFVAASYMRGIDFINIPTTTLSQIDSSIGGKTAINVDGVKNCVGAFYQPKTVLIDPDVVSTLSTRHYYAGLVEALKEGLIYDASLFELFEKENFNDHLEEILFKALMMKKTIVEQDEKETGLRKILNFGHTIGHGYESYFELSGLYHGEAVALGMIPFIQNEELKQRTLDILHKMNMNTQIHTDTDKVFEFVKNDKKSNKNSITTIQVFQLGSFEMVEMTLDEIKEVIENVEHNW